MFLLFSCLIGSSADASTSPVRIPSNQTYLGAYVNENGATSRVPIEAEIAAVESRLGRKLDIDHMFYPWTTDFITWRQTWDVANGRIPMVSWGRVPSTNVISGSQDALIVQRAREAAAFGKPIFIRWSAEMDGGAHAGVTGTPAQFIAAWQRIHDLFVANGATNVAWVWCPNASGFASGHAQLFYPGDRYVDWVCADGYNWSPLKPGGTSGGTWRTFQDIFSSFYAWASGRTKPIMIGETGAQEGSAGAKASWIAGIGSTIEQVFPKTKALVYFDDIASSNQGGTFNWRLTSSTSAANAFTALGRLAWFRPTH